MREGGGVSARVQLPPGAKPAAVMSQDETRPHLCAAYIDNEGDDWFLWATDSYRMVRLRLDVSGDPSGLPGWLSRQCVEAVQETGQFEIENEMVEVLDGVGHGLGVFYERPSFKVPDWRKIIGGPEPEQPLVVGVNGQFVADLAKACGSQNGVKLIFDLAQARQGSYLRAIKVEGLGTSDAEARLMPVRVDP